MHEHKVSKWFQLEDNLIHKVALSPLVISVWIKMDYWITWDRVGETDRQKKKKWIFCVKRTEEKCVMFFVIVKDVCEYLYFSDTSCHTALLYLCLLITKVFRVFFWQEHNYSTGHTFTPFCIPSACLLALLKEVSHILEICQFVFSRLNQEIETFLTCLQYLLQPRLALYPEN